MDVVTQNIVTAIANKQKSKKDKKILLKVVDILSTINSLEYHEGIFTREIKDLYGYMK